MRKIIHLFLLIPFACIAFPFASQVATDHVNDGHVRAFAADDEQPDTLCLATVPTASGERSFLVVGMTGGWTLAYSDDGGKTLTELVPKTPCEYDFFCCYGLLSPDKRYLYVAGDIMPNSTGWLYRYHVYRFDARTLRAKHVTDCAALWTTRTGFACTVHAKTLNPEACAAEMIFTLRDEEYDFHGHRLSRTKPYPDSLDNAHSFDEPEGWTVPH